MEVVDLRSDTVTKPTPEMRAAMAAAEVGDDVYGEDPTVNRLQELAAEKLGFEAAIFAPSGSMANQMAVAAHTSKGQEVVLTEGAHLYEYELGMMAVFSGVVPRFVRAPLGIPDPDDVRRAVRHSPHQSPTGLISLEDTHNTAGGTVLPLDVLRGVRAVANDEGLPLHLDGARVFNAAAALNVDVREITGHFDSVMISISKGLGAPVGSILAGSRQMVKTAHRYRKMMGGGMRQAGILAAAGIMALEVGPTRLAADHARARRLGEGLAEGGLTVNLETVQTNMVYARVPNASERVRQWAAQGVLASAMGPDVVRFVTHFQVSDDGIGRALDVVLSGRSAA